MSREVVEPKLPPSPMVCGGEKALCCGCVGTVMPSAGSWGWRWSEQQGFLQEEHSGTCFSLLLQYNPNLSAFRACWEGHL